MRSAASTTPRCCIEDGIGRCGRPQRRRGARSEARGVAGRCDELRPGRCGCRSRDWSTRTRIRSLRAIASRISPRGCAARSRRSGCATRSSERAMRCSIRRRFTRARFVRDCERCCAHGTTTLETKTGYALHKTRRSGAARSDRRASRGSRRAAPGRNVSRRARAAAGVHPRRSIRRLSDRSGDSAAATHGAVYADAFCEPGFFSPAQTRRYLDAARLHGLRLRVHCDEMAFGGAAAMAAAVDVDAVDHCNYIRENDVRAIAQRGIVTVACPATIAYLGLPQQAPVRALLEAGATVALASDYNPGTSPCFNLQTVAYFGRKLFGLSAAEALYGVTRAAAHSLRVDAGRFGPAARPISSRSRSSRPTSSAGSSAAISPARGEKGRASCEPASSCAVRARWSAASCAKIMRLSCATGGSSPRGDFVERARRGATISRRAPFRPTGSSFRVLSTVTAMHIRFSARLGRRLTVCAVAQRGALPRRSAADARRRLLDVRRGLLGDAGAGITTVAEFFYLNGAGNAHAEAAIRAAARHGHTARSSPERGWMPTMRRRSFARASSCRGTHARADGALSRRRRLRRAAFAARRLARDDSQRRPSSRASSSARCTFTLPRRRTKVKRRWRASAPRRSRCSSGWARSTSDGRDSRDLRHRSGEGEARRSRRARHPQSDDQSVSR